MCLISACSVTIYADLHYTTNFQQTNIVSLLSFDITKG